MSGASGLHVAFGGLSLALTTVTAALMLRSEPQRSPGRARFPWRDYMMLTKPRIMVLLLLTAVCGAFVGEAGVPSAGLLLALLGGLALACGGASALNHLLDRDIDQYMSRTDRRPVATGRIAPERALEFGLALSAFSFVVLASFTTVLAAALAVFGNLFYVIVYTRWLKRSTPQNIVIGGAAGAVPAVVGWAAVTGNLTLPALFLFLIVFYWTPPHFWALALLIRRDYEAANVPMLPVVRGEHRTAVSILRYTVLLLGITLLPFLFGESELDLPRDRGSPRRCVSGPRHGTPPRNDSGPGTKSLQLLARLPRAAVRRDGDRPDRPLVGADVRERGSDRSRVPA